MLKLISLKLTVRATVF